MKERLKSRLFAVAILGLMGLGMGTLTPTVAETVTQVSQSDEELSTEATQLIQQLLELQKQGKYNEAIPIAEQVLTIVKQELGDNHLLTAFILQGLAGLYQMQGRYTEVEPLLLEALAIAKQQSEDNPSLTGTLLNNLAVFYQSQGKYKKAEPLLIAYKFFENEPMTQKVNNYYKN